MTWNEIADHIVKNNTGVTLKNGMLIKVIKDKNKMSDLMSYSSIMVTKNGQKITERISFKDVVNALGLKKEQFTEVLSIKN